MDKKAIFTIKGSQSSGKDKDSIELITSGRFSRRGDNYYLVYKESEMTGLEGVTTTIKVEPSDGTVTLKRFGAVRSQMIFKEGQRHLSHYETPHGAFLICVSASSVKNGLSDSGGDLSVSYTVEVNSALMSRNTFVIDVKEADAPHEHKSNSISN